MVNHFVALGEFRALTFKLVNRTAPLGADKENVLANK